MTSQTLVITLVTLERERDINNKGCLTEKQAFDQELAAVLAEESVMNGHDLEKVTVTTDGHHPIVIHINELEDEKEPKESVTPTKKRTTRSKGSEAPSKPKKKKTAEASEKKGEEAPSPKKKRSKKAGSPSLASLDAEVPTPKKAPSEKALQLAALRDLIVRNLGEAVRDSKFSPERMAHLLGGVTGILSSTKNSTLVDAEDIGTSDILRAVVRCESVPTLKLVQSYVKGDVPL